MALKLKKISTKGLTFLKRSFRQLNMKFNQSNHFYRFSDDDTTCLREIRRALLFSLYIGNIFLVGNNLKMLNESEVGLSSTFVMKDMLWQGLFLDQNIRNT